jgi:hypothetical protein
MYHDAYELYLDRQTERLLGGAMSLVILDPAYGADLVAFCASTELVDVT